MIQIIFYLKNIHIISIFLGSSNAQENNQSPNSNDSNEDDDNSDSIITEMKFVPLNKNNLKPMFDAMSECQALHPDPQDNYTDGNFLIYMKTILYWNKIIKKCFSIDEEDIYEDAEEDEEYSDAGDNVDMHSPGTKNLEFILMAVVFLNCKNWCF